MPPRRAPTPRLSAPISPRPGASLSRRRSSGLPTRAPTVPPASSLGSRKLSDAEYATLTYAERIEYAEQRTRLANGNSDASKPSDPTKPATADQPKIKIGENFAVTEAEARGLMERAALEELRKLTLPGDPSKYALTLPKDFVTPQGIEYKIDEASPAATLARQFAHEAGLSQEQFSKMVAIHAAVEVQQVANLKAARDAEVAKLGATAAQRITAAETFLRGHLGDEFGKNMCNMMVTEKHVRGFELLMQKFSNGGSGTFSPARHESGPARISDADWSRMSYGEQKAYAERASANSGGRRG